MGILKKLGQFILHYFFMSAVFSLSVTVMAEQLNEVDTEALNKTIELLNSKQQREGAAQESPEGQKADRMAKELMGDGQDLDALYKTAGDIFRQIANDSNGDLQLMMRKLQEAQKNPQAFYQGLSDEQKAAIKQLGDKANDRRQLNNNQ